MVTSIARNYYSWSDTALNSMRIIANMAAVSVNLLDAYVKVCEVVEAGGIIVTVDEGRLGLNIKEAF